MGKNKSKTDDFREKEVINIADGKRLGYVSEIEFDVCDGKITAIVVSNSCGFGKSEDILIPWEQIRKIGEDIILVDACGCCPPQCGEEHRRKRGFI